MRFILDIANKTEANPEMEKIINFLSREVATIHCIDETNNNQFHDQEEKNFLTQKQIKEYNNKIMKQSIKFRPIDDCLKEDKKTLITGWLLAPVITVLSWGLLIYLSSL